MKCRHLSKHLIQGMQRHGDCEKPQRKDKLLYEIMFSI